MYAKTKSLFLLCLALIAVCGIASRAQADDKVYHFVNKTNHEVTLALIYPQGVNMTTGAPNQMKLKAGQTWDYTVNTNLPNIRIDLSGGTWENYKGTVFFAGNNFGAASPGTYNIK